MDITGIKNTIQLYFDASFENSSEKMGRVLHPAAHVYGRGADGQLTDMLRDDFVKMVGEVSGDRPPYPRENEIVSIELTGEYTAVAVVKLRVFNTRYTDVLSFINTGGEWLVIAKLLSGVAVG